MKTCTQYLNESKSQDQFLVTFKKNGKAVKQYSKGYDAIKNDIHKVISSHFGPDSADLQTMDIMQKVKKGKPKGFKVGEWDMVVQLKECDSTDIEDITEQLKL